MQGISRFVAKIGMGNIPSQKLFGELGFRETGCSEVFREVAYECRVEDIAGRLASEGSGVRYQALCTNYR